jgi:hypothetical protein
MHEDGRRSYDAAPTYPPPLLLLHVLAEHTCRAADVGPVRAIGLSTVRYRSNENSHHEVGAWVQQLLWADVVSLPLLFGSALQLW